jgi:hypothetical protein
MRYRRDFIHKLHRIRCLYNMIILVDLFFRTTLGVGMSFLDLDLVNLVSLPLGLRLLVELASHFRWLQVVGLLEWLLLASAKTSVPFKASALLPTANLSADCGPTNFHRSSAIFANRLVRSLLCSSSTNS